MNWRREKSRSSERASALASIVFPTPGKSSMIRCPSATRQSTQSRSVSAGACTTRARLPATRSIAAVDANGERRIPTSFHVAPRAAARPRRARRRDPRLRRLRHLPLALPRDEHDLVVGRVEPDVRVAPHRCRRRDRGSCCRACARFRSRPARADLGAEADEHLAVLARRSAEARASDVARVGCERRRCQRRPVRPSRACPRAAPPAGSRRPRRPSSTTSASVARASASRSSVGGRRRLHDLHAGRCAARRGSRRAASPLPRAAAPPPRARRPCARTSGCRGTARRRAARACRRP